MKSGDISKNSKKAKMKTSEFMRAVSALLIVVLFGACVADKVNDIGAVIGLAVSSVWLACEVAYVIWMTGGEVAA